MIQHQYQFLLSYSNVILLAVIAFYIVSCPYTKVEESFNIQAMHDITSTIQTYIRSKVIDSTTKDADHIPYSYISFDHFEFPGVVPRTCIGSLIVSLIAAPIDLCMKATSGSILSFVDANDKLFTLMLCRSIVGFISWHALITFAASVSRRFNNRNIGKLLLLLISVSFHLPFYISRTLPNIYAFILVTYGWSYWMDGRAYYCINLIAVAMIIFRCDMLALLAPLVLQLLISHEIQFFKAFIVGFMICVLALATTVAIDSYFWDKVLWPEGVVLFFNTVSNKSSEWGIMPWHWYMTNALLKSFNIDSLYICIALIQFTIGKVDIMVIYYTFPAYAFIALYSLLPHKELRFIFPAYPLLFMAAAVGLNKCIVTASNSKIYKTTGLLAVALSQLSVLLLTCIFYYASRSNYPGGHALTRTVAMVAASRHMHTKGSISIHVDVTAAMTGVSRFVQTDEVDGLQLVYSKNETLHRLGRMDTSVYNAFDYIIVSVDEHMDAISTRFDVVDTVSQFDSIKLSKDTLIDVTLKPSIYVMQKKSLSAL